MNAFSYYIRLDIFLAGKNCSVLRAISIIQELEPSLGLFVNISKCEFFCQSDTYNFQSDLKESHQPHFGILGVPAGDYLFLPISLLPNPMKHSDFFLLEEVAIEDALTLLC